MHDDTPFDLFGSAPPPASGKKSLAAGAVAAKRSPLQREFDRLTGQIEERQALLAAWQQQPAVIMQKYHAELEPVLQQLTDVQKSLVVQLDALLTSPPKGLRMTARRRDALTDCLLDLIDKNITGTPPRAIHAESLPAPRRGREASRDGAHGPSCARD